MNKTQQAILDYITTYSTKRTLSTLGIQRKVDVLTGKPWQPTHIRVLAIPVQELLKKPLVSIGKDYHKLIVAYYKGNIEDLVLKNYGSIDDHMKDDYIIQQVFTNKRIVLSINGNLHPVHSAYDLAMDTRNVLYNSNRLFHLIWDTVYVQYMPSPAQLEAYYNNNEHGSIIYSGISSKRVRNGEREPYPELVGREVVPEDLETTIENTYETILMHDLELTDLIVDDNGDYVTDPESDKQYETISYGNGAYFEDVVKQEAVIKNTREYNNLKEVIMTRLPNDTCVAYYRNYIKAYNLIKSGALPLMMDYLDEESQAEYNHCIQSLKTTK